MEPTKVSNSWQCLRPVQSKISFQEKPRFEDINSGIIDAVVHNGGDSTSGFFVGDYSVLRKFGVSIQDQRFVKKLFTPREKKEAQKSPALDVNWVETN